MGVGSYLVNEIWLFKAVDWEVTTELWAALSLLGDGSSLCPVQPPLTRAPALDLAVCWVMV